MSYCSLYCRLCNAPHCSHVSRYQAVFEKAKYYFEMKAMKESADMTQGDIDEWCVQVLQDLKKLVEAKEN